jgi:Spy/CpxP family protein refolding chaperone
MRRAQPRFIELQWVLAEVATLSQLVRAPRPDEARVLQQLDRVLDLERQTKRTQVEMLLRIKNSLTDAQREMLSQMTKRQLRLRR